MTQAKRRAFLRVVVRLPVVNKQRHDHNCDKTHESAYEQDRAFPQRSLACTALLDVEEFADLLSSCHGVLVAHLDQRTTVA